MPKGKPYELPDDQCERLRRNEMIALRLLMSLVSEMEYVKEDLSERLECVPNGKARLNMMCGNAVSLFRDILGTVTDRQRRQLRNSAKDFKIKLVPALTPMGNNVMITLDEVMELTDCAREKCKMCAETGETCRKCRLYQWLEANIPLDDYGDGIMCPYANIDWGD